MSTYMETTFTYTYVVLVEKQFAITCIIFVCHNHSGYNISLIADAVDDGRII